nr:hypothetical protein CFP56_12331 [Quercus suber]
MLVLQLFAYVPKRHQFQISPDWNYLNSTAHRAFSTARNAKPDCRWTIVDGYNPGNGRTYHVGSDRGEGYLLTVTIDEKVLGDRYPAASRARFDVVARLLPSYCLVKIAVTTAMIMPPTPLSCRNYSASETVATRPWKILDLY